MRTAEHWHKTDEGRIQCDLCPHHCCLAEGQTGRCKVRGARNGELKALYYGVLSSVHMDPIEKKPLYHFHPGSLIFSIGGWGCNFACVFCQNWTISQQVMADSREYSPDQLVRQALSGGSVGVAYTYNEPIVGFEFVRDCARLAREAGLVNVMVTNGYVETAPAKALLPLIDALNIDIKSMEGDFYKTRCRGELEPVLNFAKQAVESGCHVEITNLVIPGLNDREDLFRALAQWIGANLGPAIPLHLSAYRPEYKLTVPATPGSLLERAHSISSEVLKYVYLGNVRTRTGQNTCCPRCGAVLIARQGYAVNILGISGESTCAECGRKADIVLG